MYLISEFSKITQLTVKTLHYYDKEGILVPYKRHEQTGYRYYNEENYQQAQTISLLRQLDFSISEIKEVLTNHNTEADFAYFLKEKRQQIEARIATDRHLLNTINTEITRQHTPKVTPQLGLITETNSHSHLTISQKFSGRYEDVNSVIEALYKEAGKQAAGPITTLLYDDSYQELATMRICLPIKRRFAIKQPNINFWQLTAEPVLSLVHFGSYHTLSSSYKRLLDYAKEQKLTLAFPSRESYLKGPGKTFSGNPDSYQTQLMIPFKHLS